MSHTLIWDTRKRGQKDGLMNLLTFSKSKTMAKSKSFCIFANNIGQSPLTVPERFKINV